MTHCEMTDKSEPSSQSVSQLFIAILRPRFYCIDFFLLQLNLPARLCQLVTLLKVFTAPCVLSTIPEAIPANLFPQNAKERLHQCNSLDINILPITLVHLAKTTLKVTSSFFYFPLLFSSLIFLPLAFGHLNFPSH